MLHGGAGEYDEEQIRADCMKQFNVSGSGDWPVISLGGFDFSTASNIVFSNGEYDPWRIGTLSSLHSWLLETRYSTLYFCSTQVMQ